EETPYANQHVARRLLKRLARAVWRHFDPAQPTLPTRLLSHVSAAEVAELERTGLLQPSDVDRSSYHFPTPDFASFLAARHIAQRLADNPKEESSILSTLSWRMYIPAWHQFFVFAAGITHDPGCLLAQAVNPDHPDTITCRRLALAVRMLRESRSSPLL